MYTKSVSATNFGPLGENRRLFVSIAFTQTQLAKKIVKKLSPKINVKIINKNRI